MAVLFPVFKEISTLFSIAAVLVCIPTNSVRGFPFLHTLSSIYCLKTFGAQLKLNSGNKTKPIKNPTEFLERIYQVYKCYTDTGPKAPENVNMINMTFIRQSAPEIKKLQKLDSVFERNPSQLVDVLKSIQQQGTETEGDAKWNTGLRVAVLK